MGGDDVTTFVWVLVAGSGWLAAVGGLLCLARAAAMGDQMAARAQARGRERELQALRRDAAAVREERSGYSDLGAW